MIQITLPDSSTREYGSGVTGREIAASIGKGLAKAAVGVRLNGEVQGLLEPISDSASIEIITKESKDGLEILRHSAAHILADAVKRIWPKAKLWKGPPVDDERYGFYYDIDFGEDEINQEDLERLEKLMAEIVAEDHVFERKVYSRDEALALAKELQEDYKTRTIERIPKDEELSFYQHGSFIDLCRGPHIPSTGALGDGFAVLSIAGAYLEDDAGNKMLTRIYGHAFADKKAMAAQRKKLEEAKKRDHRRIGKDLDLFSSLGEFGAGLILWHPKGGFIRHKIEEFWRQQHLAGGYDIVYSPHIAKAELWEISGHLDFYADSMYKPMDVDEQPYLLKPMNCPFHVLIYKSRRRSYRELPMRWAELGTVYRYESAGVLHGLMRVRGFTQDDAHLFVTPEQLDDEIVRVLDFVLDMLRAFGFEDFKLVLSTKPEKAVGSDEIWEKATLSLRKALEKNGTSFEVEEGGGAFYGPKIDVTIRDAIGRDWQCSTIQCDFNLPERFDLGYTSASGARERPIMLHRALLGSLERFFGILIEHSVGCFPLWLAPLQLAVITLGERHHDFAMQAAKDLRGAGLRVELDISGDKVGAKVRRWLWEQKLQFVAVIGDKEVSAGKLALRHRHEGELGCLTCAEIIAVIEARVEART